MHIGENMDDYLRLIVAVEIPSEDGEEFIEALYSFLKLRINDGNFGINKVQLNDE